MKCAISDQTGRYETFFELPLLNSWPKLSHDLMSAFFSISSTQHFFNFSVRQNLHEGRPSQLARENAFKGEGVQVRHLQQIISPGRRGQATRAAADSLAQCGALEWESVAYRKHKKNQQFRTK